LCNEDCVSCSNESTYCSECKNDASVNNFCLANENNKTIDCDESLNCQLCTINNDNNGGQVCLECNNEMKLQNGRCVNECSVGFYHEIKSNRCFKCDHICTSCESSSDGCIKHRERNESDNFYFYGKTSLKLNTI
jgi:proprotein convertase subtilisin/kexin type 5